MEIAPGVHLLQTRFFNRSLTLPIYQGDKLALADTGLVGMPVETIAPEMKKMGFDPAELDYIFITHAHADHFGGNEEFRSIAPKAQFVAHRLDQEWLEDPPGCTVRDYSHYVDAGLMTREGLEDGIKVSGNGVKIDRVIEGGEEFDLGQGIKVEVVFAPGHSPGNTCLFEKKSKVLFNAETVGGSAQRDLDGNIVGAPYYYDPEVYMDSMIKVAKLDFQALVPSHIPPMNRREAIAFMRESVDFALDLETELLRRLQAAQGPVTSTELLRQMDGWRGIKGDIALYMVLHAHLERMLRRGCIEGAVLDGLTWKGCPAADLLEAKTQAARAAIDAMK